MQIDWITVAAQLINFAILVWVLKKLLYGPVIAIMAQREADISDRFKQAQNIAETAKREADTLARERADLNAQQDQILEETRAEAQNLKADLVQEAKQEADHLRQEAVQRISAERAAFSRQLARSAPTQMTGILKKCLSDLADADLEQSMAKQFAEQLTEMDDQSRDHLARQLRSGPNKLSSAAPLKPEIRKRIETVLSAIAGSNVVVEFETGGHQSAGVILETSGKSYAWTVDSFIDRWHKSVVTTIEGLDIQEADRDAVKSGS